MTLDDKSASLINGALHLTTASSVKEMELSKITFNRLK
jgi:hypothetical protein